MTENWQALHRWFLTGSLERKGVLLRTWPSPLLGTSASNSKFKQLDRQRLFFWWKTWTCPFESVIARLHLVCFQRVLISDQAHDGCILCGKTFACSCGIYPGSGWALDLSIASIHTASPCQVEAVAVCVCVFNCYSNSLKKKKKDRRLRQISRKQTVSV